MAVMDSPRQASATSFLNDPVIRGRIYQVITAVLVVLFVWFIASNTVRNLAAQHKSTGFDFFWDTSGFDIQYSLIDYSRSSIYFTAFLVGVLNTLLVSIIGIVCATLLGFLVGIMRLSRNWLISHLALVYVEALRNVPLLVYWLSGAQLAFELPVLERFNFRGGVQLPPELLALVFGLTIYTAAFIAENVRGGVNAVNKGQTEAAQSLGLRDGDRLRLVVIPQAMRVIVPPLTSQYLNLTKNSSLGAAIGYPELVNVFTGTTLNQTGKAIEVIALTMGVYLTFSLLTSVFMNWYNGRVALVER
jgi:general L-amino acid transport system permease protein